MIFTVFQYIPILEEETSGHRVELAKKAKGGHLTDGDPDPDEDCDEDNDAEKEYSYFYTSSYTTFRPVKKTRIPAGNALYKYLLEHIDTPPPKI
jgi:hypothetical protein